MRRFFNDVRAKFSPKERGKRAQERALIERITKAFEEQFTASTEAREATERRRLGRGKATTHSKRLRKGKKRPTTHQRHMVAMKKRSQA